MSQPPPPSADGPVGPWTSSPAPAPVPGGWPTPPAQGSGWEVRTPAWQPAPPPQVTPTRPAPTGPAPTAPTQRSDRSHLVLVGLAALAGTLIGAVAAAFLVASVVDGTQIGADIADEMQAAVRDGVVEGTQDAFEQSMEEFGGSLGDPFGTPPEDVEQFPPVAPGDLGPDPVLDGYAQQCFEGDLQACDDLLFESPPLSPYEEYASTCGGRVKTFTVPACTDLD